jgi:hypothetical protein
MRTCPKDSFGETCPEGVPLAKPGALEQKPPIFKKWNHWYTLLIAALVVQIFLYLWLTLSFG